MTHDPEAHSDQSHAHGHGHAHLDEADWAAMAEVMEARGEVFSGFVTHAIAWVGELRNPGHGPIGRILDVGSGPGVAACAFAAAFPAAEVVAADSSPAMLERATARAQRLGVSDRFRTVIAELPDGVDGLGDVDLVWASMALHHVGDEVSALRAMGRLLRPGGMIIVAEFPENESPMTTLPPSVEAEVPGLGQRLADASSAWFASMRSGLAGSTPSRALGEMVGDAGLEVVGSRVERIRLDAPLSTAAQRVAVENLVRVGKQMVGILEPADRLVLERLCDPANERGLLGRSDLFIEAAELVVAIQKPTGGK